MLHLVTVFGFTEVFLPNFTNLASELCLLDGGSDVEERLGELSNQEETGILMN